MITRIIKARWCRHFIGKQPFRLKAEEAMTLVGKTQPAGQTWAESEQTLSSVDPVAPVPCCWVILGNLG